MTLTQGISTTTIAITLGTPDKPTKVTTATGTPTSTWTPSTAVTGAPATTPAGASAGAVDKAGNVVSTTTNPQVTSALLF
jgi:hypothetical protein